MVGAFASAILFVQNPEQRGVGSNEQERSRFAVSDFNQQDKEYSMSFQLLARLRKSLASVRQPSYTASHVAVMTCLADRINDKTGICFPAMQTIADESYIGERQARKVVSQLEQDGVVIVRRFGRRSSHYSLNLPLIKQPQTTDFVGNPVEPNAGLKVGEQAERPAPSVAEARLTYNLNSINEPARDEGVHSSNGLGDSASQSFLSEAGSKTQNPVKSSSELTAPCNEVKDIHALLIRKLRANTPGPSKEDTRRLQIAIEKHGLPEVHQMIEWVFKQKNDFWRKRLKAANFPCSFLCDSLPSIERQFKEKRADKSRSAEFREQDRAAKAETVAPTAPASHDSKPGDDVDPDFGNFYIDEDALED